MNNILPQNGRIVIVDDKIDEALPLITLLSKNGNPTCYFSGDFEELPSAPSNDIRILFMDLRLTLGKLDEKTIISNFIAVFNRLISSDNGPFILVLWSKHDSDYSRKLSEVFDKELSDKRPAVFLNMDKSKYLSFDSEGVVNYSIDDIENRLHEELKKMGAIEVIILWESFVHRAASETIAELTSICNQKTDWVNNIASIFKALAKSRIGKNINSGNPQQILIASLYALNDAFISYLQRNISSGSLESINMDIAATSDLEDADIKAKLNSKLLLQPIQYTDMPGTLYKYNNKEDGKFFNKIKTFVFDCLDTETLINYVAIELKLPVEEISNNGRIKGSFKNEQSKIVDKLVDVIMPVLVEVSPECDFAQKKWKVHRLLPGLAFPFDYFQCVKQGDYLSRIEPLEIENKVYGIVFDLRYLTALPLDEFTKIDGIEPICAFRTELVTHLQSLLARHVGRIGVASV